MSDAVAFSALEEFCDLKDEDVEEEEEVHGGEHVHGGGEEEHVEGGGVGVEGRGGVDDDAVVGEEEDQKPPAAVAEEEEEEEELPPAAAADFDGPGNLPALPPLLPGDASAAVASTSTPKREQPAKRSSDAIAADLGDLPLPDFPISAKRKKNENGAILCSAEGCDKNAQARTRIGSVTGFCRVHHNSWLISTGQVGSWDCACGKRVVDTSDRCGACHRWRDKRPPFAYRKRKKVITDDDGGDIANEASSTQARARSPPRKKAKVEEAAEEGGDDPAIAAAPALASPAAPLTYVPSEELGIEISTVRETNERGRTLCKVVGCKKLDQSKNDGFCRMHFNKLAATAAVDDEDDDEDEEDATLSALAADKAKDAAAAGGGLGFAVNLEDWTCSCGVLVPGKQKRCGKCNKWKGGKREPYQMAKKRKRIMSGARRLKAADGVGHWTCQCSNVVSLNKSRCGKCHHWRGGKRKGGWKIDPKGGKRATTAAPRSPAAPGTAINPAKAAIAAAIDWDADWECCGNAILARQRRCGKCHKWRGGVRIASARKKPAASAAAEPSAAGMAVAVAEDDPVYGEEASERAALATLANAQGEGGLPAPEGDDGNDVGVGEGQFLPPEGVGGDAADMVKDYTVTEYI